ncbi:hypothetical protein HYALB_00010820 [Hymenoscyphus albidus]|uniref:Peptidase S9 prolyl oligopeptidase catalytic domain-containing protein n=1 Tax=Hymenoscyphus albidus TaxID=595503 RepID=A0A9N9LI66_9HELO|nr:hypothetical protein HYALB_00010820 [Hymenoscyphus albidus]
MSLTNYPPHPLTTFPPTVFPNVELWNITNSLGIEYQVQISRPFEWTSRDVNATALTMYVLDANALGSSASEAVHRRKPVDSDQTDIIVVSIGYPLTSSPYSDLRYADYIPPTLNGSTPPISNTTTGVTSRADEFLNFVDGKVRPFVQKTLFPNVQFTRDAIYGHSGGGMLILFALLTHPYLFDTYLASSPFLAWYDRYFLLHALSYAQLGHNSSLHKKRNLTKPAFALSYGALEQYPIKRRTETWERYQWRKDFYAELAMQDNCEAFFELVDGGWVRDKLLRVFPHSDHATLGGAGFSDGIDYFVD